MMPVKGWKGYEPSAELVEAKARLKNIDSKMKGSIAESYVMAHLAELGFDVWRPYMNNHKADLAILQHGQLICIQAKSAGFDVSRDRFRAMLTTRDKTGKHIKYLPEAQDFFIVKCESLPVFYVIPAAIGIEHHSMNFYPHRNRLFLREFDCEPYREAFDLIREFDPR